MIAAMHVYEYSRSKSPAIAIVNQLEIIAPMYRHALLIPWTFNYKLCKGDIFPLNKNTQHVR